jgi:hypothetical protein
VPIAEKFPCYIPPMRIIMLVFTVSLAVAQTSPPALAPSTVAVSKFPSVSTDRDWVDYGLLVFNFGLVLIGFFGVVLPFARCGRFKSKPL